MKRLVGSLLVVLACASPAYAQDIGDVSRRTATVTHFDLPALNSILDELAIPHRVAEGSRGRFVTITFANGVRATLLRSACRPDLTSCKGLTISARFGKGQPRWTERDKLKRINDFNYRHSFIKAGLDTNGQFYLSRYELNDFGVTRGSIATSLLVFSKLGERFIAHLKAE